jgi:hypothetical protein
MFCTVEKTDEPGYLMEFKTIASGLPASQQRMGGAEDKPAAAGERNCFDPLVEIQPEKPKGSERPEKPIVHTSPKTGDKASEYCKIFNRFVRIGTQQKSDPKLKLRLHIRSVGEIFQFLGDLVYYQDELARLKTVDPKAVAYLNNPVTFGYCSDEPSAGCDDVFIRLDDACNARFSVSYRNGMYHVADFNPSLNGCPSRANGAKDHTLAVLAVLHQLIGLNRSATDIRQTPAVQLVP